MLKSLSSSTRKDRQFKFSQTETLTNKMIPFKTSFESTPTLRSSRHSLSNFSGVSLLRILTKRRKNKRFTNFKFHKMSNQGQS